MATYRLVKRAGSAFRTIEFPTYEAALDASKRFGTSKPQKKMHADGIKWAIVIFDLEASKPEYKKVPTWTRPVVDQSLVIAVLRALPDVASIEANFEPQPFIERRAKPRVSDKDGNVGRPLVNRAAYGHCDVVSMPDCSDMGIKAPMERKPRPYPRQEGRKPFNGLDLSTIVGRTPVTA